ncbi:MAG: hypothetical protein KKB50_04325 [Planctomycetes bacterium]|nr:hypothetical protein [Planctomycetota bacterium]
MRYVLFVTLVLAAAATAAADPFYLRYDPDEGRFPEQEGWGRYWDDPEDKLIRSVDNGVFRLDTRGSVAISDLYEAVSDAFILEPEEELHVRWRMETVETGTFMETADVVVGIVNKDSEAVEFFLAPDFVSVDVVPPPGAEHFYTIEPGVVHSYEFVTPDMWEYDLYVDDQFAFHGAFDGYAWRECPRIGFGDAIRGLSSLSEWEYVEIAVVPEPGTWVLALLATAAVPRTYRGRSGGAVPAGGPGFTWSWRTNTWVG